jgi:hypothetical protein
MPFDGVSARMVAAAPPDTSLVPPKKGLPPQACHFNANGLKGAPKGRSKGRAKGTNQNQTQIPHAFRTFGKPGLSLFCERFMLKMISGAKPIFPANS